MSAEEKLIPNQPCLCCGSPQEPTPDDPWGGALAVRTSGMIGSATFDGRNERYLQFSVCADCLRGAARRGRVLLGTRDEGAPTPPVPCAAETTETGETEWEPAR